MSFNVRNQRARDGENGWEFRRELLCQVIRAHRPDVLGIQEAYLPQVEQMRQALPEYEMVGVGRDDGVQEGEFCSIFYGRDRFQPDAQGTFWLSETPEAPGSIHWGHHNVRICTWVRLIERSGKAFTVYNTHLDHESQWAREQSARLILERIRCQETPTPVLLLGDFNMGEDNPALAILQTAHPPALQDTFRAVHPNENAFGTFHGFTGSTDGEKIDYILASLEFQVREARILHDSQAGRYPSDHFPITARLTLD